MRATEECEREGEPRSVKLKTGRSERRKRRREIAGGSVL